MPKKKPTAAVKRYRRWIAEMPCEGCKIEDDTRVSHHFTFTQAGMGKQSTESNSVCLCYNCHIEILHRHGELSFWAGLNRTKEELIEYANNLHTEYHML